MTIMAARVLTLLSTMTPQAARGSATSRARGRAEVKYQWRGWVPHSELLQTHDL